MKKFNIKKVLYEIFYSILPRSVNIVEVDKKDYELVYNLFTEGVNSGCYTKELTKDRVKLDKMVINMLESEIAKDMGNKMKMKTMICTYGNYRIGFISLAIDSINKEVEVSYFSIENQYKSKKIGSKLFKMLITMIRKEIRGFKILVRSNGSSEQITKILNKNSFVKSGCNKQGFSFYYL